MDYINFTLTDDPAQTERKSDDTLLVCELVADGKATITGTYSTDASGTVTSTRGGSTGNGQSYP